MTESKKYSIVIPTYNNCDKYLVPCIESVFRYTNEDDIELIVSANGCTDNTLEYLTELWGSHPCVRVVWSREPLGYPMATNAGIRFATADKIVLLNNDTVLLPQEKNTWLDILEKPFLTNPRCGVVGDVKIFSEAANHDFAIFFCVMIKREVFDAVGLLNEDYGIGMGEDIEFCIEAERAGYEVIEALPKTYSPELDIWVNEFPIQHFAEGTMHDTDLVKDYGSHYAKNLLKLAKKYNRPWYARNSLSWVKADKESEDFFRSIVEQNEYHLSEDLVRDRTVIDVGANRGIFSLFAAALGAERVVSFEPVGSTFEILNENAKRSGLDVECHRLAVSDRHGVMRISLNSLSGQNSLYTQSYENDRLLFEEVETVPLVDIINNVPGKIFLKLDCEGSEYDLILSLTERDASRIETIVMEIHEDLHPTYKGSEIIHERLTDLGYERVFSDRMGWWQEESFEPLPLLMEMWKKPDTAKTDFTDTRNEETMKPMRYSIVIPTYNHCEDLLKPCVNSIFKNTDMTDVELVVSANGCTDGTVVYLNSLRDAFDSIGFGSHLKVVWSDEPLGYSRATNAGIRASTGDRVILLNNDTTILDYMPKNGWIDMLEKPFLDDPECGLSGPSKRLCEHTGRNFLIFYCVMIKREVFDRIGLLNEEYGTGAGEDTEFCIEAENAGFSIHACDRQEWNFEINMPVGQFPIFHPGEGTVHDESLVSNWTETFIRNSLLLEKKYKESWRIPKIYNDRKVGVITSVRNGISDIVGCVDSVKSQDVWNVFHYVHDDGSTDNLKYVLDIFSDDPTVTSSRSPDNHGLSHGRNVALTRALDDGCEVIAFLDVDDRWNAGHLRESLRYLAENDVVYSRPKVIDLNGNELFPSWRVPERFDGEYLYESNFIWVSSVVAKASCFGKNRFDESLTCYEDWDMWLTLHEQGFRFFDKDSRTVTYRYNENTDWGDAHMQHERMIRNHTHAPRTVVIGFSFNETRLMPYFMEHYSRVADRIVVVEGDPNYGYGYLKEKYDFEVVVIGRERLDDQELMDLRNYYWHRFKSEYDYVIVVDADEFLEVTKDDVRALKEAGVTLPTVRGYQMVSRDFPKDLGEVTHGFADPVHMNKQAIFSSSLDHVNYSIGCHTCDPVGDTVRSERVFNLYHYKYVGFDEFRDRSKRAAERVSDNNRLHGWGIHYLNDSTMTEREFSNLLGKSSSVKPKTNLLPVVGLVDSLAWLESENDESGWLFNEVVRDNCYGAVEGNVKGRCVIDVGANMGTFSVFAAALGAKLVLAVEPVSSTFGILEKNVKRSGFENVRTFRNAVTGVSGEDATISLFDESGKNGMYGEAEVHETVKSITLTDLLSYTDGRDVFLKMDCEGAEYDVIMNASKEDMSKVSTIGIEIHSEFHPTYKGVEVIRDKLTDFGFKQRECRQMGVWYDDFTRFEPGSLTIERWSR